jgi:hypothetical protein
MKRFSNVFGGQTHGVVIGMVHVPPTPSAPKFSPDNRHDLQKMVDVCVREAMLYAKAGVVRSVPCAHLMCSFWGFAQPFFPRIGSFVCFY